MAIAVAVTAAIFACAFGAMTSRTDWSGSDRTASVPTAIVIPLPFQKIAPRIAPRIAPKAAPPVAVRVPPRTTPAPVTAPAIPPPIPPPIAQPTAPSAVPTPAPRDSGRAPANPTANPTGNNSPTTATFRGGAPIAPAGVTNYGLSPEVRAARDSLIPGVTVGPLGASRSLYSAPTAAEREAIVEGQRRSDRDQRRSTTAGNTRDLVILHGDAANGAGAATNGKSVSLPLFSSGPSAAQRRRNAALDSEYNARLGRLEERLRLKRDSARVDSLRRDSLRRDSLARRRVIP